MLAPIGAMIGGGLIGIGEMLAIPFTDEGIAPMLRERKLKTHEMKDGKWIRRTLDSANGAKSAAESIKYYDSIENGSSSSNGIGDGSGNKTASISFGNITINAGAINPSDLSVEVTEKLMAEIAYTFRNNFGTPFKGGIA
jgi:hypothetical protein